MKTPAPPRPPGSLLDSQTWTVSLHGITRELTVPDGPALPETLGEMDGAGIEELLERIQAATIPATCEVEVRVRSNTCEFRLERTGAALFASVPGDPNRSNLPVTPESFVGLLAGQHPQQIKCSLTESEEDESSRRKPMQYRSLRQCRSLGVVVLVLAFALIGWTLTRLFETPSLAETVDAKPISDGSVLQGFQADYCQSWATGEGPGHRGIELTRDGQARLFECSPEGEGVAWQLLHEKPYSFQQEAGQAYAVIEELGPVHLIGHGRIRYYGDAYVPLEKGFPASAKSRNTR
ncbi:MAG: hypothetical protein ACFB20_06665 [Opitutales bacterium]